jgi:heme oxygenase
MSDDKIWAEGLLIFYEIFRFLENSLQNLSSSNEHFRKFKPVIMDIERTTAFESDLSFFYGKDFLKSYTIRPSVADYLRHLQTLEQREPLRLLAYVYHLYMGLLSGGQILKKKREFGNKMKVKVSYLFGFLGWGSATAATDGGRSSESVTAGVKLGTAVTSFPPDGRSIADIKKEIAFTMNDIAADLSRDERNSLIDESMEVFRRNNEIVGSIQKTGMTALKNYAVFLVIFVTIGAAVYFYMQS